MLNEPQYVDLQINGHGGVDFLSATSSEEIRIASRSLYAAGVMSYLPTLITSDPHQLTRSAASINAVREEPREEESRILGFHLEGPFISHAKCGVHPQKFIREPNIALMREYLAIGNVRMLTLAPELPGALDLIRFLVDQGITVSLGHSNATIDEAHRGFDAGATTVTHLFNGMSKFPGLAQAALERDGLIFQIIVDDVHVTRENVALAITGREDRFILTNDTVAPAGSQDGLYKFGDMTIEVKDRQARRVDGTLAGGIGTLADSIAILKEIGINEQLARAAATTRPLDLIGE
jgi:N-acetylglucosamine-6-phosphate deacetylase